jgi:hypothetical protein
MLSLTNAQIRIVKAQAQRLKATLKIGKEGSSPYWSIILKNRMFGPVVG